MWYEHRHLPFHPSIRGKMSWWLSCTVFLSLFLFYSNCFNHFIICLPFSFSLQAGNLVLEHSLGCQATSFSLFRFSGKTYHICLHCHPDVSLSPLSRVIRHYYVKQQQWRSINHQVLHHPSLRENCLAQFYSYAVNGYEQGTGFNSCSSQRLFNISSNDISSFISTSKKSTFFEESPWGTE